jgi:hypothetical protein
VKLFVDDKEVIPTVVSQKRPNGPLLDDHYHHAHLPALTGKHTATVVARVIATQAEVRRTLEFSL